VGTIDWIMGFLEANSSFAVNIGFKETKYKKSIIFKPYITIAKVDKEQVSYIQRFIKLEHANIRKKTKSKLYLNDYYSLNIQNNNDIDKVIELIKNNEFKSKSKQESFDGFVDCYDLIKTNGKFHHKWLDDFSHIIEKKIAINKHRANINSNRLSKQEWEKRIKNHLK
jgi:hypothetical protein